MQGRKARHIFEKTSLTVLKSKEKKEIRKKKLFVVWLQPASIKGETLNLYCWGPLVKICFKCMKLNRKEKSVE